MAQARGILNDTFKREDWVVDLDPSKYRTTQPVLSTNSFVLDTFLGGRPNNFGVVPFPGIPKGKIIQLYGHEASGKTTLALEMSAAVCRNGGTVCYIDWENEVVPEYAHRLGVPIGDDAHFILVSPDTLEEGFITAYTMASAGVDLIIFDSVGAAVPKVTFEKALGDIAETGRIGLVASFWSTNLPKLKDRVAKSKSVVLGISQIRANISTMGYGEKNTVQGGNAWKFYSALRLLLKRIATEKGKIRNLLTNQVEDGVVGSYVKVRADKCKQSSIQGNETNIYIRYGEGIDNLRSLIDIAISYKIIVKAGSWVTWTRPDGSDTKVQGIEKVRDLLVEKKEFQAILESQVRDRMYASVSEANVVESVEEDLDEVEEEEGLFDFESAMRQAVEGLGSDESDDD